MSDVYTVKTDIFEGPLEVLLSLIEKRKLFINDISLASVANDYIVYMNTHKSFPLSETAHFILIASTLLLIKSKSLLPMFTLSEEEEQDIEELERRLKLYTYFKKVSRHVKNNFGIHILFSKNNTRSFDPVFSPDSAITTLSINESIHSVLVNLPKKQPDIPKKLVQKVLSIEEVIENLTERVTKHLQTSFKEFSGMGKKEKTHVIVSFLAMLELVKQGLLAVRQDELFSDIVMEPESNT